MQDGAFVKTGGRGNGDGMNRGCEVVGSRRDRLAMLGG